MNRNTSSYLSSSVRHLLRLSFENCRDTSLNNQALQCLRKEGQVLVFEDQPIQCLLGNVIIDDYSQRNGQWYKRVLRRLSPLFNYCHDMINRETFKKDLAKDDFYLLSISGIEIVFVLVFPVLRYITCIPSCL